MADIQPVPQWAPPFLGNREAMEALGVKFNPVWLKWFIDLINQLTSGGSVQHNLLSGLQGGTAGEYYHLTQAQHTVITGNQSANTVLAGPASGAAAPPAFRALTVADGATGLSTYTQGDMLYASALNTLSKRAISTSGKILRSDGSVPQWSTATYPDTVTANQVLYGTATNTIGSSANLTFDGSGTMLVGDGTTGKIQLGGTSSSFPMLKRTNTFIDLRLADDSAFAPLRTSTIQTNGFTLYTTQALSASIGSCAADTVSITFRTTNTTANGATFGHGNTGNTAGNTYLQTAGLNQLRISPTGRVSIGGNANAGVGTAWLHLPASTTAASTAPLKFTSGTLMTTAEAGAFEFLTDKFYATITTGAARKELTLNDTALTSGRLPLVTTNGRLTDSANALCDTSGNATFAGIIKSTQTQGWAIGGVSGVARIQHTTGVFTPFTTSDTVADFACNNISFGTHSAIGAETLTGYITITDVGGTSRKLGVVS